MTINYISITEVDFQNRAFFIYETENKLFGIFDSNGLLIKLPEFTEISKAKEFVKEIMN